MSSLAELPELVGFFSYSREDDEDSQGALSALRYRIQRELRGQLGRSMKTFRLWQDKEAIASGKLWETEIKTAVEQSVFFVPIITPTVVKSPYCRFELDSFLAREAALGRNDLVFPILYIKVPALEDNVQRQNDPVISIIAKRQYLDWREFRHRDVNSTDVKEAIERFCAHISNALHRSWLSPDERKEQEEAAALQRAEAERKRQEAETKRREEEARKRAAEAQARERADHERRKHEAEAKQRRPVEVGALGSSKVQFFVPGEGKAERFKDLDVGPELVVVPAGSFTMGSLASEAGRNAGEGPRHRVTFAKPFAVGRFALTFDEWDACIADGGTNRYKPSDRDWGRGRQPVINVSWDDAKAYVAWLSKKTGKSYRLLSEAEWEYVTRTGTTAPFWWGDTISTSQANYDGNYTYTKGYEAKGVYRQKAVPVDAFEPNPWGLYQVHGNVWEWTEDCWNDGYEGAPADGSAWTSGDSIRHVVRGGSWGSNPDSLRSANRHRLPSDYRGSGLGFRVARTLLTP
jgi:formylglycine-generating enzyme required for sulfatase activity